MASGSKTNSSVSPVSSSNGPQTFYEEQILESHGGIGYNYHHFPKVAAVHSLASCEECRNQPRRTECTLNIVSKSINSPLSKQYNSRHQENRIYIQSSAPFFNSLNPPNTSLNSSQLQETSRHRIWALSPDKYTDYQQRNMHFSPMEPNCDKSRELIQEARIPTRSVFNNAYAYSQFHSYHQVDNVPCQTNAHSMNQSYNNVRKTQKSCETHFTWSPSNCRDVNQEQCIITFTQDKDEEINSHVSSNEKNALVTIHHYPVNNTTTILEKTPSKIKVNDNLKGKMEKNLNSCLVSVKNYSKKVDIIEDTSTLRRGENTGLREDEVYKELGVSPIIDDTVDDNESIISAKEMEPVQSKTTMKDRCPTDDEKQKLKTAISKERKKSTESSFIPESLSVKLSDLTDKGYVLTSAIINLAEQGYIGKHKEAMLLEKHASVNERLKTFVVKEKLDKKMSLSKKKNINKSTEAMGYQDLVDIKTNAVLMALKENSLVEREYFQNYAVTFSTGSSISPINPVTKTSVSLLSSSESFESSGKLCTPDLKVQKPVTKLFSGSSSRSSITQKIKRKHSRISPTESSDVESAAKKRRKSLPRKIFSTSCSEEAENIVCKDRSPDGNTIPGNKKDVALTCTPMKDSQQHTDYDWLSPTNDASMVETDTFADASPPTEHNCYKLQTSLDREERIKTLLKKQNQLFMKMNKESKK